MKRKAMFGALGLVAVTALAYGVHTHMSKEKWLETSRSTSACSPDDEQYFLSALRGSPNGAVSDADGLRTELLLRIANDCTIKSVEGNPLVTAFDTNFKDSTSGEREDVFKKMKDPSLFFTKRVMTQDAAWAHLDAKQLTELAPIFAAVPAARKAVIAERYSAELRDAALEQRNLFTASVKELSTASLPRDAETFGTRLESANSSLQLLAELSALANPSQSANAALREAASALTAASKAFKPLAAKDIGLQRYAREDVIVGPEVFVLGAVGHYYLSVLPAYPKMGRILLHVPDGSTIPMPGVYRAWVRKAKLEEIVRSDSSAWIFTYEAADAGARENIEMLRTTAGRLIGDTERIAAVLNGTSTAEDSRGVVTAAAGAPPANGTLQAVFNAQYNKLHEEKSAADISQQDIDRLAQLLAHPTTAADWQYLAKMDEDYSDSQNECNTADCAVTQSIVAQAEQLIRKTNQEPPAGVSIHFKLDQAS